MKYSSRVSIGAVLILLITLASITSCGGGGGGGSSAPPPAPPPPPPPSNQAIGGAWVGSDSNGLEILALVTEDGRVHWVAPTTGEQGFGTGSVNGNDVTFDYTFVAPLGFTLDDGSTSATCTATGTIQERQSLAVTTNCTTNTGGTFSNSAALVYDTVYDRDSSLAVISGNYDDFGLVISVDANGVIFEQDPFTGCVTNGQVSIINSQFNAYDVSITFSSCLGNLALLNGATFTGLAILDNTASPEQVIIALTGAAGGVTISNVSILPRI